MSKKILLICFDTPYPDNYGGAVDMERKFKFFRKQGFCIDLICSSFHEERTAYFEQFIANQRDFIQNYHIENVNVNFSKAGLLLRRTPFSVLLRKFDFQSIDFIGENTYDMVLVEHLKSTHSIEILKKSMSHPPKFWLRMHNDEAAYYGNLAKVESHFLKKLFFVSEHLKYKAYQSKILKSNVFDGHLFISTSDKKQFEKFTEANKSIALLLPIYQENLTQRQALPVKNVDFLYVGNLDLNDNFDALKQMIHFLKLHRLENSSLSIVGKCTGNQRKQQIHKLFSDFASVEFSFNVDSTALQDYYNKSKFFLNFSSNKSGVKTKLIDALDHLLPVISDENGVFGSGYEKIVWAHDSVKSSEIQRLISNENAYLDYYKDFEMRVIEKSKGIDELYHQWIAENYG